MNYIINKFLIKNQIGLKSISETEIEVGRL
jgi:hypothetical protein